MAPLGIAFLILMVAAPAAVYGIEHTVGGSAGWNSDFGRDIWASATVFTIGDTLVFNFLSNHSVDEVNLADYNGCSSSNTIQDHSDSPTKITLSKAGPRYFICPTPGHCEGGMKLMVNVVAASTPSGTPPTTPTTTPSPPATTPPSPPATTPPPPPFTPPPPKWKTPASNDSPPPPSSPASGLHMNLVGVPLVLATLIAFMG